MKLPRMPKAVVFDMDGLLFDTEALYQEAILAAAAAAGHEMPASVSNRLLGSPWVASRKMLIEHYGEAFDIDALWSTLDFQAIIGPPMEQVMTTLLIPHRDHRVAEGVAAYRAD